MSDQDELIALIDTYQVKGRTNLEIQRLLLTKGYSVEDINGAFARLLLQHRNGAKQSTTKASSTFLSKLLPGVVMVCALLFVGSLTHAYWPIISNSVARSFSFVIDTSSPLTNEPFVPFDSVSPSAAPQASNIPSGNTHQGSLQTSPSGTQTAPSVTPSAALSNNADVPTVTLEASATRVTSLSPVTLTWSSTNATSCTASTGFSTHSTTSGSVQVTPLLSTSYTVTCKGPGGMEKASVFINTTIEPGVYSGGAGDTGGTSGGNTLPSPLPPSAPLPTLTLSAAPTSITSGQGTVLTWSGKDASSCTASGGWSGTKATSGTQTITNITAAENFSLSCTGTGGTVTKSVSVVVSNIQQLPPVLPSLTFTLSPTSVTSGGSATLSWSAVTASSCTASGGWSGTKATSGTQTLTNLTTSANYTLTCSGVGGSTSKSVTLSVTAATPPPPPPPSGGGSVTGATPPTHSGSGKGYYVDFASGSDTASGTSAAPWKHAPGDPNATGGPASVVLAAGDTVYFRGGVHYYGQINLKASGVAGTPITYDGESWGGKAIIDGSDLITTWTKCASAADCGGNSNWSNIYKTSLTPPSFLVREPEIRLNLTQGDQPILPAQYPLSTSKYYQAKDNYYSIPPSSMTATTLTDSRLAGLGGSALVGAWMYIWATPNDIKFVKISAYNPSTNTATFSPSITPYTTYDTQYAVTNANTAAVFNQPGEYVYDLSSHTLYVWPLGGVNPNGVVNSSTRALGFNINSKSHVVIRGFLIYKQTGDFTRSGGGLWSGPLAPTDVDIEDNEITLTNSDDFGGISVGGNGVTIANNFVHDLLGNERGIQSGGNNVLVKNNTLRNISRTGIYFAGMTNGRMTGNLMTDSNSTHGNGLTVYQGSDHVMVDNNVVIDANIAFTTERSSNLTVTNNVFDGAGNVTFVFADWGTMTGANAITHNTIIGSSNDNSTVINTKTGATWDISYNIIDGGDMHIPGATAANNVYTVLGHFQSAKYGWSFGPGESLASLSTIFVAPGTHNYHTTAAYKAYGAQSVSTYAFAPDASQKTDTTLPRLLVATALAAAPWYVEFWLHIWSFIVRLLHLG